MRTILAADVARGRFVLPRRGFWLVWEAGPWRPRRRSSPGGETTQIIDLADIPRPAGEDAFCFYLGGGARYSVGRRGDCDVVVNDMTLSREHFHCTRDGEAWTVEPYRRVELDGVMVEAGRRSSLPPGASLVAGAVHFTFHDGPSFERWLAPPR